MKITSDFLVKEKPKILEYDNWQTGNNDDEQNSVLRYSLFLLL